MEEQPEKEKRKVHRSPSYPAFDLGEAIIKADAVYKGEKRSATTPEVIASHMGYTQANGPGGRAVSALRQFGLIEESSGKYRISDLGYTLAHFDRNSDEWKKAAADAARRPTLFRELLDEYPDGLPSDATLRNDLLKRDFNPGAISDVVSILRNTISLAGVDQAVYSEEMSATVQDGPKQSESLARGKSTERQKENHQAQISTPVGTDGGQVVFAHVNFDSDIKKEFVSSLKKYLDYLETTLQ
jgi:hypothetical protein